MLDPSGFKSSQLPCTHHDVLQCRDMLACDWTGEAMQ